MGQDTWSRPLSTSEVADYRVRMGCRLRHQARHIRQAMTKHGGTTAWLKQLWGEDGSARVAKAPDTQLDEVGADADDEEGEEDEEEENDEESEEEEVADEDPPQESAKDSAATDDDPYYCPLYTSDAADEEHSVALGRAGS